MSTWSTILVMECCLWLCHRPPIPTSSQPFIEQARRAARRSRSCAPPCSWAEHLGAAASAVLPKARVRAMPWLPWVPSQHPQVALSLITLLLLLLIDQCCPYHPALALCSPKDFRSDGSGRTRLRPNAFGPGAHGGGSKLSQRPMHASGVPQASRSELN